jgi:hypothetical protein
MLFAQTPTLYTTQTTTASSGIPAIFWVIYIAFIVLFIVANWKIFTKADEAGWKSLIPFYNTYIMLVIAGLPGWYLVLLLIPFVNIIIAPSPTPVAPPAAPAA